MHLWASLNAVGRNRRVPSFWQRLLLTVKTAYVPFFSPLGVPICIHVQRFFLTKEIIKDTHSNYPVCLCFAKWYNPTSNYSILKTL